MSAGQGKRKKIGRWIIAGAVVLFLAVLFGGSEGLFAAIQSYRELRRARAEISALRGEIDSLTREIKSLRNDTLYLERIARQRLGMARTDERVYKFLDEK